MQTNLSSFVQDMQEVAGIMTTSVAPMKQRCLSKLGSFMFFGF